MTNDTRYECTCAVADSVNPVMEGQDLAPCEVIFIRTQCFCKNNGMACPVPLQPRAHAEPADCSIHVGGLFHNLCKNESTPSLSAHPGSYPQKLQTLTFAFWRQFGSKQRQGSAIPMGSASAPQFHGCRCRFSSQPAAGIWGEGD